MRFAHILPFAVLGTAFVLPDEKVFNELSIDSHKGHRLLDDAKDAFEDLKEKFDDAVDSSRNAIDDALSRLSDATEAVNENVHSKGFDAEAWLYDRFPQPAIDVFEHPPPPPHQPHDPHDPHHGPPHKKPCHPPHHDKPNSTIYQLISESKYTTKLAKLVTEDEELVKILNGTAANCTLFAPTDKAFEKIPKHGEKPSKELIRKVLLYHISPDFYPAGRVFHSYTIPTLLKEESLGTEPLPQRLAVKLGFKGLTVNFYSRIVAMDIFGTNGVIHGVDSIIIPPPKVVDIIDLFPTEFSTLTLGLSKTGLLQTLSTSAHAGGTLFAPSNFAFKKLGPKINAFLFSKYGTKYLKALLEYHVVANQTLYSDAFYRSKSSAVEDQPGKFHLDLPTLLKERSLSIDIARFGPFISIKINGFSRVTVHDGVAKDGVIQVVGDVLIPPKRKQSGALSFWEGEEMSEEELMERLEPFVRHDEEWEDL